MQCSLNTIFQTSVMAVVIVGTGKLHSTLVELSKIIKYTDLIIFNGI